MHMTRACGVDRNLGSLNNAVLQPPHKAMPGDLSKFWLITAGSSPTLPECRLAVFQDLQCPDLDPEQKLQLPSLGFLCWVVQHR